MAPESSKLTMAEAWHIAASAPGKLVVSGEYAVLAGAPALVAAVDRRVRCTLSPRHDGGWHFVSTGFSADAMLPRAAVFRAAANTMYGLVRHAIAEDRAPEHLRIAIDSSACYLNGLKLGVGSSAAMVTTVSAAFAALGGEAPSLSQLYELHAAYQGGGSGLDVAAAVTGGFIRFQERRVAPARWPASVRSAFVFTGTAAHTPELLARFDAWRANGRPQALERLADAAQQVADCTVNAESFIAALGEYTAVLQRFDRIARIGIFSPGHRLAHTMARRFGIVYKPCGAGGGDTGMAVAEDADAVSAFVDEVSSAGLTVVPMEIASDGLTVRTR